MMLLEFRIRSMTIIILLCNEQGQTREHALLARPFGIRKLIVVVNKMDDPTAVTSDGKWSGVSFAKHFTQLCCNLAADSPLA